MTALGLNYAFLRWTSDVIYPYFIGEYTEEPNITEDNLQDTSFLITGTTRGSFIDLETAKANIEKLYRDGKRIITTSGTGVVIFYESSLTVPTDDAELKKIQINLLIKEWKVN
jgi:hypothetical protein